MGHGPKWERIERRRRHGSQAVSSKATAEQLKVYAVARALSADSTYVESLWNATKTLMFGRTPMPVETVAEYLCANDHTFRESYYSDLIKRWIEVGLLVSEVRGSRRKGRFTYVSLLPNATRPQ